jgi:hypothetical protein
MTAHPAALPPRRRVNAVLGMMEGCFDDCQNNGTGCAFTRHTYPTRERARESAGWPHDVVRFDTREAWLTAAVHLLAPAFDQIGSRLPERLRVSCSWPSRAASAGVDRAKGQCWSPSYSADTTTELFISPTLDEPAVVTETLVHELVHAAIGPERGHGPAFRKLARRMGLAGPLRTTTAGAELATVIESIVGLLGLYPHARVTPAERNRRSNRQLKLLDPTCGLIVRASAQAIKSLDDSGGLFCGYGHAFRLQTADTIRGAIA